MLRGIIPATVEGAQMPCLPEFDDDDGGVTTPNDTITVDDLDTGSVVVNPDLVGRLSDRTVLANETILRALTDSISLGPGSLNDDVSDSLGATLTNRLDSIDREAVALAATLSRNAAEATTRTATRRTAFDGGVTLNTNILTGRGVDATATINTDILDAVTGVINRPTDTVADTIAERPSRLEFTDATRRVVSGEDVGRAALLNSTVGVAQQQGPNLPDIFDDFPKCPGKVLASPLWDTGEPVALGDRSQSDLIADLLADRGIKHGPLSDVVEVDSGLFIDGHVLMWVNRGLLNDEQVTARGVQIHYLDDEDTVLDVRPLRFSDLLTVTSLPPRWVDPTGPWIKELYPTFLYGQYSLAPASGGLREA